MYWLCPAASSGGACNSTGEAMETRPATRAGSLKTYVMSCTGIRQQPDHSGLNSCLETDPTGDVVGALVGPLLAAQTARKILYRISRKCFVHSAESKSTRTIRARRRLFSSVHCNSGNCSQAPLADDPATRIEPCSTCWSPTCALYIHTRFYAEWNRRILLHSMR